MMRPSLPKILVVEDEPLVRLHVTFLLEDQGYEVWEASSAEEAIASLERDSSIRVVLTDIQLAGTMDGLRLVRVIAERWPPVRLILTSAAYQRGDGALPEDVPFLPKPYRPAMLLETLAKILA